MKYFEYRLIRMLQYLYIQTMCIPCKSKRVWSFVENRMTGYPLKFDHNQVEELRKKFNKVSANKDKIEKGSFQQNMGILGLKSAYGFSDRLFNSFDIDKDGKISFQDFLEYMEVLKSGSEKHKAKISFWLIDIKNKDKVDIEDFKQFLNDYFRSWTSITNSIITPEIKERADQYVNYIFKKVKRDTKRSQINFQYYAEKLYRDKEFIEAFEFITEGVANMFISDNQNDGLILYKVLKELRQLHNYIYDENKSINLTLGKQRSFETSGNKPKEMPDVMEEEHPQEVPSYNPKFMKKKKKNKQKLDDKTKEATYTQNISMPQASFCKNCLRLDIVEKKVEYLMQKIKVLVEDTRQVYDRLVEKYQANKNFNMKKETIGNVHVHRNKTEGDMVFFGDDNWNLVLNMMIGIQMAVTSVRGYQEMIYDEPKDFNLKYYFELASRKFGDEQYQSKICSFTDYAPQTFNQIRKIFKIDNDQYIQSIGPKKLVASLMMGEVNSMTSLTSQGKSGSFFYYTADGKYMLKTIQYRQYKFLRQILEDYYYYIKKNPQTMITKFYGLHKLIQKDKDGDVVNKNYFVIMANIFNTKGKIVQRYDIKGSSYGRENLDPHPNATKKDNDFRKRQPLELYPDERSNFMKIIRKDAEFFRKLNIIDYSLLIGVIRKNDKHVHNDFMINLQSKIANESEGDQFLKETRFFDNIHKNESYIFGIIDILTEYTTRKTMEYYFKKTFYGEGISAVPPDEYSQRFVNFIDVFVLKKGKSNKVKRESHMEEL